MGRFEIFFRGNKCNVYHFKIGRGFNSLIFMLQTLGSNGVCTYTFCHGNIFLVLQNE